MSNQAAAVTIHRRNPVVSEQMIRIESAEAGFGAAPLGFLTTANLGDIQESAVVMALRNNDQTFTGQSNWYRDNNCSEA